MTLQGLKALLLTIGPPVFHYFTTGQDGNYILWAEDGEGDSVYADDEKTEQALTGTVDYFTKTEFDPIVNQIQDTLNDAEGLAWSLNSVQHETDTKYIHYEWTFEIDGIEGVGIDG